VATWLDRPASPFSTIPRLDAVFAQPQIRIWVSQYLLNTPRLTKQ